MIKLEKSGDARKGISGVPAEAITVHFSTNNNGMMNFNRKAVDHLSGSDIEFFYCEDKDAIVVKPHIGSGTSYRLHRVSGNASSISVMNVVAERSMKSPAGRKLIGTVLNGELTFPIDTLTEKVESRGRKPKTRMKNFCFKAIANNQHVNGTVKALNEDSARKKIPDMVEDYNVNIISCKIRKTRSDCKSL